MSALPQQANVQGLSVSFDAYIRHGWSLVPIAPNSKGPKTKNWNRKENCLTSSAALPPEWGVGLAHAYSGTMALDIDNYEVSNELLREKGIDLGALFRAPDAVGINSGNPGHAKLIYQMPFGLTLPSKKINHQRLTAYELRCATADGLTTQDVIPPTRHISGTTYQWCCDGNWQRLPIIPPLLLDLWQSIIDADTKPIHKVDGSTHDASWDEVVSALHSIDPDCNREEWLACGMALHSTGNPAGFTAWDEWSSHGKKYVQREMASQWASFKDRDDGITIGSLFHYANGAGWVRPMPDVSSLFAAVKVNPPKFVADSLRLPPPDLDLSLFNPIITRRCEEVAVSIGCDPIQPLWASLATIAAAADNRIRLELTEGWKVPPILWLATIGDPSQKKTPAARPIMGILKKLEEEDVPRYKKELLWFEAQNSAYTSSKKAYLKAAEDSANLLTHSVQGDLQVDVSVLPPVAAEPVAPAPLRMTVSDITSQSLVRTLAVRPRGVLCHLDEMRAWVSKLSSNQSGEDRSAWTVGYECDRYVMDRVMDGTTVVETYGLSIYGNMQPLVFEHAIKSLADDGLIQRFIPAVLRHEYTKRGEPIPEALSNTPEWENLVRSIHNLEPKTYRLSPDAYERFRSWQLQYEQLKHDERLASSAMTYITAIGKLEGTLGRLALIMHLSNAPNVDLVPLATIENAIRLVDSYIVPSFRYCYGDIGGLDTDTLDKWVSDHILCLAGEHSHITLSHLKRSARRQIEKLSDGVATGKIMAAMELLESNGWVAMVDSNRKTTIWAINPIVATFETDRKERLNARQRIYDHIHITSGGKAPRRLVKGADH